MEVWLVDGTYELFRHHFGQPSHQGPSGAEVAATRGVLSALVGLLEAGATHVGVATDHVIESFRNELWPGYKTSAGVDPALLAQFPLLEEAVAALGLSCWAMVELEADDALASAAATCARHPQVSQALICTPDKDLAQAVVGDKVVQLHRRGGRAGGAEQVWDEAGVWERFGVGPESVPDYLALVGDSADGYPGLAGWGPKSAAAVLARFGHLEAVPDRFSDWGLALRGGEKLADTLAAHRDLAYLFRDLATLRVDEDLLADPGSLRWEGPRPELAAICRALDAPALLRRAEALAASL